MAGSPYVQAVGPSYHLADRKAAVQSAINCYLQPLDAGKFVMLGIPGETLVASLGAEIRNFRDVEGRFFVVSGYNLIELASDGTSTVRGTLLTSTGFVGLSHNTSQLVVVDGLYLYVLTLATNILVRVTADGWLGSNDVHEIDGYMIFVDPGTQQFYISGIENAASLNALDFSSADSQPDNIITHRVSHRQLWLFGRNSTEIWVDSGAAAFPFARYNSYTLDVGIVGERAAIFAADTLYWVGQTKTGRGLVYTAQGNQPKRVSTLAVEQALASSSNLSGATMWSYQVEGHEFIGIDAPGLTSTWVYDAATDQWHERGEWSAGWLALQSRLYTAFGGSVYAGDVYGDVVKLDMSSHTLSGRPLVRERTWPHVVSPNMDMLRYRGVELAARSGQGGSVTLELSNDGGASFGPPLLRSLGAVGRVLQRVRWNALGASFNRVFRLRVSDSVDFALYSATVDAG